MTRRLVGEIPRDDEALEAQGTTSALAVDVLGRRGAFDAQLIDVLADTVGVRRAGASVQDVELAGLKVGARLADDAITVGGTLLATRGQDVSEELRERLTDLRGIVRQPLRVHTAGHQP